MDSFSSTTQADDDVFAPWADPLIPLWATGGQSYSSALQGIHHAGFDNHNFNAANYMAFSAAPITPMGTFTSLLNQENYMSPDVPDPWSIPAQHRSHSRFCHDSSCSPGCKALLDASFVAYQPVGDTHYAGVSPFATDSVTATFNEGMSPNDSLTSPTSVDEGAWFSEPGRSTCTTPSSSYGGGEEAGWVAPEYGANTFGNATSLVEWTSELSWPIPTTTFVPTVTLGKRRREAEEPHGDGGRVDIHQIPPKKRARGGGVTTGIPKAARSVARTRHKPVSRIPVTKTNGKPKEAGRGAERLATPSAQGLYHQSLLGPLQQGWAEESADGKLIWVEGSVDENVVPSNDGTMQQQQEETGRFLIPRKFAPKHKKFLKATEEELVNGVQELKCRLCPETYLKSWEEYKVHCVGSEAHPSRLFFCDHCGDYFARNDARNRHLGKRPDECKRATKEEAKEKRRVTNLAHEEFSRRLDECLKTGEENVTPFSQIIKGKYPKSSKKRISSSKKSLLKGR